MNQNPIPLISIEEAAAETQRFMIKVYGWMSFALIVTGLVAMYTASFSGINANGIWQYYNPDCHCPDRIWNGCSTGRLDQ